eukprot:1161268-Pelagomonas_calceolata.AAC.1
MSAAMPHRCECTIPYSHIAEKLRKEGVGACRRGVTECPRRDLIPILQGGKGERKNSQTVSKCCRTEMASMVL